MIPKVGRSCYARLTVIVAPRAHTEDMVGVLVDYSAVGLLGAFAWVDAQDAGGAATPATLVRDGRSEPVVLQQLLTGERYDRVRVAVLVPPDARRVNGLRWPPNRPSNRPPAAPRWGPR